MMRKRPVHGRGDTLRARYWKKLFAQPPPFLQDQLEQIYGPDPEIIWERLQAFQELLEHFERRFGPEAEVLLLRIPGRVNLLGVHIEHHGGYANYLAIEREILFAIAPSSDDRLTLFNIDSRYAPFSFAISQEFPQELRGDWQAILQSPPKRQNDWSDYFRAAAFYFQNMYDSPLKGMKGVVGGNIPPAAGLSSSSALVVGAVLAIMAINNLHFPENHLPEMCGEAEWYVGTRGGAGDHAAILLGRRGHISHVCFFPFQIEWTPFPDSLRVVVCHSAVEAAKARKARETFNQRVTTYDLALMLLRHQFPQYATRLQHLRDLSVENIEGGLQKVYHMIATLPTRVTRRQVQRLLPTKQQELERLFASHREPKEGYPVRAVALFGAAECHRSRRVAQLLREGRFEELGKLMFVSHDGDRVSRWEPSGDMTPWSQDYDDAFFEQIEQKLKSNDPHQIREAQLEYQPGSYRCSIPEIDRLVDWARQMDGVLGAGLTGGGLGGVVRMLVEADKVQTVIKTLKEKSLQQLNKPLLCFAVHPIQGASIIGNEG